MSFHPDMRYESGLHVSQRELRREGEPFAFTPENRERLERIAAHYPPEHRRSAVIPAFGGVSPLWALYQASVSRTVVSNGRNFSPDSTALPMDTSPRPASSELGGIQSGRSTQGFSPCLRRKS